MSTKIPTTDEEYDTFMKQIENEKNGKPAIPWNEPPSRPVEKIDNEVLPLEEVAKIEKEQIGVSDKYRIGFPTLDDCFRGGGITEGRWVVISGVTGEGKTTLAQTLTYNFSQEGIASMWFTYEVTPLELWENFQEINVAVDLATYTPKQTTTGKLDWIFRKVKEGMSKYGVKVVFIDHLGFLEPSIKGVDRNLGNTLDAFLTSMCREIKTFCVKNRVIFFVMYQLKKVEGREPTINDIKNSSGIGQESDAVIYIQRLKEKKIAKQFEDMAVSGDTYTNEAKITLIKNRMGSKLKFIKVRYENGRFI